MSKIVIASVARLTKKLAADLAWAQWSALSSLASARAGTPTAIIDPEALILLSLIAAPHERRLLDVVTAWAAQGIRLTSLQRARTLAARLPASSNDVLAQFAAVATAAGDHRWKRYTTREADKFAATSRRKAMGPLRLDSSPALMLRLRAGFGAGAKADVLAMLLGLDGQPATLRLLSDGLGYGARPLRTAAEDMVAAGFVERLSTGPATFRALSTQWCRALNGGLNEIASTPAFPPRWNYWADVVVFLAHVFEWAEKARTGDWSEYVASSRARDIVEHHLSPALINSLSIRWDGTAGNQTDLLAFERLLKTMDRTVRTNW